MSPYQSTDHSTKLQKSVLSRNPHSACKLINSNNIWGLKSSIRSSKPVKPTPIGTKIIDQAKITLSEASKVEEIVNEESAELKGDFTISTDTNSRSLSSHYFVKDIVSRYKELRLIVKEHKTEDIIRLLKTGEIDAAILATPLLDEQLIEYPLFNDEMKIYASREDKNFSQQLPHGRPTDRLSAAFE